MPGIRELSIGPLSLQPSETGIKAVADAGRRVNSLFDAAAEARKTVGDTFARDVGGGIADAGKASFQLAGRVAESVSNSQISQGEAQFSKVFADSNDAWARYTNGADPNDPTVAQRFQTEWLEPRLESFRGNFSGTDRAAQWADQQVEKLQNHMRQKTAADMVTRAGDAVVANSDQSVNALSNAVRTDPTSLDAAIESFQSTNEHLAGTSGLSVGDQAKLRSTRLQDGLEHITLSAAYGYVERTGKMPPWASDDRYSKYLGGDKIKSLEQAADVHQRAAKATANQAGVHEQQAADQAASAAADQVVTDHVSFDPNTSAPIIKPDFFRNVVGLSQQYPNAPSIGAVAGTLLDWGEYQAKNRGTDVPPNPDAFNTVAQKVARGGMTQVDVMRAQVDVGLSNADFGALTTVAKQVSADAQNRSWANTIRQDVATREPAALPEISQWLATKPDATRALAGKHVTSVLQEYDAARNREAVATMPLPQFMAAPREQITPRHVVKAQRQTLEAAKAGQLDLAGIATQGALLDRWHSAVGDK